MVRAAQDGGCADLGTDRARRPQAVPENVAVSPERSFHHGFASRFVQAPVPGLGDANASAESAQAGSVVRRVREHFLVTRIAVKWRC